MLLLTFPLKTLNTVEKSIQPVQVNVLIYMCLLTTIALLFCSTVILKILWLIRMCSLAHWSYIIGNSLSSGDPSVCLMLSSGMFLILTVGTMVPAFLFPRFKCIATALTIPPQLHMVSLLHRNVTQRVQNETVRKFVKAYSVVTLISTIWTALSLYL